MLARFRQDPLVGNVLGLLALFIALGAGAYAAGLAPDSVKSKHIVNEQVKEQDLAAPEDWQEVGPGSEGGDACAGGATGVFCSDFVEGEESFWAPWENLDAAHASAAFFKDPLGVVHLKGLVRTDTGTTAGAEAAASVIFRLPEPYRPEHIRIFPSLGDDSHHDAHAVVGRVDVKPDGDVRLFKDCDTGISVCSAQGFDYLDLDGMTFRPDG